MGEAECEPLLDVEKHDIAIRHAFIDWSTFIDAPPSVRDQGQAGYKALFTELPKKRPSLLEAVKNVMGPIARYGVPPERQASR